MPCCCRGASGIARPWCRYGGERPLIQTRLALLRGRLKIGRELRILVLDRPLRASATAMGSRAPAHRHSREKPPSDHSEPMKQSPTGIPFHQPHRHRQVRIARHRREPARAATPSDRRSLRRSSTRAAWSARSARHRYCLSIPSIPFGPGSRRSSACALPCSGIVEPLVFSAPSNKSWPNKGISCFRLGVVERDQIAERAYAFAAGLAFRYLRHVGLELGVQHQRFRFAIALPSNFLMSTSTAPCSLEHRERGRRTPHRVPKPEAKRITPIRLPLSEPASSAGGIVGLVPVGLAVAGSAGSLPAMTVSSRRRHGRCAPSARPCPGCG